MCGIVACWSSDRSTTDLKTQLEAGLDKIVHRGPDGRGVWIAEDGRCGLGHCRLSINDLSEAGTQPLHSPSHGVHAIVNGELYDDGSLRAELEKSYAFTGHSDSELAIALYERDGLAFLSKLRGEFALCLYDSDRDIFIAARDRYGIKPLFWRRDGSRVWLAAEIKAFLGTSWKPRWNVEALGDGGWSQDTRTIFSGVQKLRPGHYMVCRGGSEPEIRSYWDIEYPSKTHVETRSEADMIQSLRDQLIESVRLRLRADVPVGIYLSGGIDSSALAGIATHLVQTEGLAMGSQDPSQKVCCFSIGFEDSGFDESDIAQRTADFLGVSYHKVNMSDAELALRFEEATYHIEHHYHDLNYIGKYALSEIPRKNGYKVVLTGEGADEQFAGYPLYLPDFMREPSDLKDGLSSESRRGEVSRLEDVVKDSYAVIGASTSQFYDPALTQLGLTTPASMTAFVPSPRLFKSPPRNSPVSTVIDNIDPAVQAKMQNSWHPIHSAMYTWTKGHLANQFLSCLGDRVEMAHSIEARTPFLDHHLTEYINHMPPSTKIRRLQSGDDLPPTPTSSRAEPFEYVEKYSLREAVKPFVTEEVYKRRKHAYSAPPTYPLGGPIHAKLQELLTRENVERLGFVSWDEVSQLKQVAFSEPSDERVSVWAWRQLVIVAQWVVLGRRFGVEV